MTIACMLGRFGPCTRPVERLVTRADEPGRYIELAVCAVCAATLRRMLDTGAWAASIVNDQPL